ncbi:amino acid adenylation domain-containing protein [Nocardia sp. CDC159]|uniref:Phenyloxazoline synthase MbtB n=2 Tax=Nocardia pulmonis TaxID=2951408 RepID=A0A9X2EAA4_9NOCA|nr:amino acid adenylation domain-containing protein [Nocardia sp. CDC159]MCM6776659.1 amino acid adenylation domain-containing protein [Nocardia pulmonis]MCM6789192.1 amino acid adenylation domain-containing protein [Nocardia sp. CDC159]
MTHTGQETTSRLEVVRWVVDKIADITHAPPGEIEFTTPLTQIGLSSLRTVRLRALIAERFGVEIPLAVQTIDDIADFVAAAQPSAHEPVDHIEPDPANAFEPFPLTDLQYAYLMGRSDVFELGGLGGHAYFEFTRDTGDPEQLRTAWNRVVDRHDALRMQVRPDGRQQVSANSPSTGFDILDLRAATDEQLTKELADLRHRSSHEVFDLHTVPLYHITVARLPGTALRIFFSIDLFVADLWAWRVLMRDWWGYYSDPAYDPRPLRLTFRDVVLHEARMATGPQFEKSQRYWENRILELPDAPALPAAVHAAEKRFRRRRFHVSRPVWAQLKQLAAQRSVTPSAVLLAAYSVVLARWSGSGHFTVDVTLFNRPPLHPEINDLVGDFTNVDLLEVDVERAATFHELATAVQSRLWADLEHAQAGGIKALRELAAQRCGVGSALFPVVFTSTLGGEEEGYDTVFAGFGEPDFAITQTPQVYLDHQVFEQNGRALIVWDTRDGVLSETVIDEMFLAYMRLLDHIATEDGWQTAPKVPLPARTRRIRAATRVTTEPLDTMLHDGFLTAPAGPDAVAIIAPDRTLTYGAARAHIIGTAAALREQGLGPGDVVAVEAEKGWRQVVSVAAVMAAGSAVLPIDPALPAARKEWIAQHSGCRAMLTDRDELPVAATTTIEGWRDLAGPDDLAYILYTSGSTGTPKGVAVTHRAVVNTLHWVNERFEITAADRVLGLSSMSFDLSLWDTFGVTMKGATLVLPPADRTRDPATWAELMARHGITLWNSVPALLTMLLEHTDTGLDALRLVLLSGDWIPVALPDRIRAAAPRARVIAMGGPTETSVWTNAFEVGVTDPAWTSIPYGYPLPNHELHVLNDRLEEVPDGVAGEIYIGGTGLAVGYHNDSQRTEASFITHPDTGQRLYRSGDLARYRADGCLEILGRTDFQLKVGGHRIEAGEVEAALLEHPLIRAAVVLAPDSLAAFVVPDEPVADADVDALVAELTATLRDRLPNYMVPHRIEVLTRLPIDHRGKVDRAALRTRLSTHRGVRSYIEPANPVETVITDTVAEVLGVDRVGADERFLEAGANSVALTRIHALLSQRLSVTFDLLQLFENPDARSLATALRSDAPANDAVGTGRERARARRAARQRVPGPSSQN